MATRDVFSDAELAQLRGFPEITRAELIRYFTLTGADEAFVRRFRGKGNTLGAAVQLCALPWLGFVPDEMRSAPAAAVARLAERLQIPAGALSGYGAREQTRTDHLREVARYLGWRTMDELAGSSSGSSCSPGRWSTTRPSCCSGWRASISLRRG